MYTEKPGILCAGGGRPFVRDGMQVAVIAWPSDRICHTVTVLSEKLGDRGGLRGRDCDWHILHHEIVQRSNTIYGSVRQPSAMSNRKPRVPFWVPLRKTQGMRDCHLR